MSVCVAVRHQWGGLGGKDEGWALSFRVLFSGVGAQSSSAPPDTLLLPGEVFPAVWLYPL